MRFSLSYTEGNENPAKMPLDSYETIQDCIDWADENGVDLYLLRITEWADKSTNDAYGVPDIICTINLEEVFADGEQESLSRYAKY